MTVKRVRAYSKKEIRRIQQQVVERDYGRCVIHGTLGAQIHEVLQKSSGRVRSVNVFKIKYMACVCPECHYLIHHGRQKKEINQKILCVLSHRFGYKYPEKDK